MRPQIIHSPSELATLLDANAPQGMVEPGFDAVQWLNAPGNLALRIGRDLMMFDFVRPGVHGAHIVFNSRGRPALDNARAILERMFTWFGARMVVAEVPADRPEVWVFARLMGFKRVGTAERDYGGVILTILRPENLPQSGNPVEALPMLEKQSSAR